MYFSLYLKFVIVQILYISNIAIIDQVIDAIGSYDEFPTMIHDYAVRKDITGISIYHTLVISSLFHILLIRFTCF